MFQAHTRGQQISMAVISNADREFFITELNPNTGSVSWVSTAGETGDDNSGGVVVDSYGAIWQTGTTSGTFSANGKTHQAVSQQIQFL